jgi:hypothetical protein
MKQALLLLPLCTTLLVSCRKGDSVSTEKTALTGTWKLIETLAGPGDGSGTWQPAASPLVITFNTDGSLAGNAFPQARSYDVASDTDIRFTFADGTFINYNYALTATTLILSGGGCIEACGAKFIKTGAKHQ